MSIGMVHVEVTGNLDKVVLGPGLVLRKWERDLENSKKSQFFQSK